jgi:hypothetical protein
LFACFYFYFYFYFFQTNLVKNQAITIKKEKKEEKKEERKGGIKTMLEGTLLYIAIKTNKRTIK